jgi:hypothetical protein
MVDQKVLPFPHNTLDADRAAVLFHDRLADVQAQPQADAGSAYDAVSLAVARRWSANQP